MKTKTRAMMNKGRNKRPTTGIGTIKIEWREVQTPHFDMWGTTPSLALTSFTFPFFFFFLFVFVFFLFFSSSFSSSSSFFFLYCRVLLRVDWNTYVWANKCPPPQPPEPSVVYVSWKAQLLGSLCAGRLWLLWLRRRGEGDGASIFQCQDWIWSAHLFNTVVIIVIITFYCSFFLYL